MGPLEWPHEREKVKQNLARDPEMGPYLVARKSALTWKANSKNLYWLKITGGVGG
jgi:hypothetical protein